jgi:hypothetical protein
MYGMIHRAARQMVLDQLGESGWAEVLSKTGLEDDAFISARVYDDATTLNLLSAISVRMNQQVPDLLRQFGRYWVNFAGASHYGPFLQMAGDDLVTVLGNLDRMHASIRVSLPEAVLPEFEFLSSDGSEITILYRSRREGLDTFVEGLLSGLMDRFNTLGVVEQAGTTDRGRLFRIRLSA